MFISNIPLMQIILTFDRNILIKFAITNYFFLSIFAHFKNQYFRNFYNLQKLTKQNHDEMFEFSNLADN